MSRAPKQCLGCNAITKSGITQNGDTLPLCNPCQTGVAMFREIHRLTSEKFTMEMVRLICGSSPVKASEIASALRVKHRKVVLRAKLEFGISGGGLSQIPRELANELAAHLLQEIHWLTPREVAYSLEIHPSTVTGYCKNGTLHAYHFGRRYFISPGEMEDLREGLPPEDYLETSDFARMADVSPSTAADYCHRGYVKCLKFGAAYFIEPKSATWFAQRLRSGLSAGELAARCQLKVHTVISYCASGIVEAYKVGTHYRIPTTAAEAFLRDREVPGTVTVGRFATSTGMSRSTIQRLIRGGHIEASFRNGHYRIPSRELRWFRAHITVKQAAKQLEIPGANLRGLMRSGRIKRISRGQTLYITRKTYNEIHWEKNNLSSLHELGAASSLTLPQMKRLAREGWLEVHPRPLVGKRIYLNSNLAVIEELIRRGYISPILLAAA